MSDIASETRLWNLMRGAMTTKALGIAADLRLAEVLGDAPRPLAEVAQETGADPSTLHRILRALASDGVFVEDLPGVFSNTESSALLRDESWREFAHLFGSVFTDAVNSLDPHFGEETFSKTFGTDFWSWLQASPDERRSFDTAMAGGKEPTAEQLAQLDWREDETVVDIGGGNGALMRELLRHRPQLRAIVFDLPETVRDEASLGDRIDFVAGSFFESVPPGDAYVLSGILHDWNDERAGAILRTIRTSAPQGARLLLIESVVQPGNEPQGSKWLDLLMLVLAGGRERTAEDWRPLVQDAGFAVESIDDGLIRAACR